MRQHEDRLPAGVAGEGIGDKVGLAATGRRGHGTSVDRQDVDVIPNIASPRKDIVNECPETCICFRQIGANDVAGNVLHIRDRLEPPSFFCPARPCRGSGGSLA